MLCAFPVCLCLQTRPPITCHILTWEADLKHYSLLPVFNRADGGELVVKQEEEGACQQANQAHEHAVVARVCVLIEDAVESLAAHVDITLVHDGGEDHQGKYLLFEGKVEGGVRVRTKWATGRKS